MISRCESPLSTKDLRHSHRVRPSIRITRPGRRQCASRHQRRGHRHQDSQSGGNNSSGWNVGVSIGIGQGAGISVFANANKGKGKEEGNGSRWNETVLSAGDTLNLQSGRDASLTGAQASGKTVVADIGRNLTLQSQQDRDYYHSQQSNLSAGASFTFGSMSGSASISGSRQKADSDFVSVQQQTGLYAGQGGFDIKVGQHTQLDGAVIASTAKADKNTLDTGTLGFSNQHNQADYKVESQSFGFSSGGSITGTLKGTLMSQGASSVLGGGNSSGHAESTTYAAVSEGAIKVRDQDQQQQDLKALSRDAEHAANGLSPIFDKEKELNRLQEAQLVGQIGAQATQIVATQMMMKANEELRRNPKYADSKEYKELNDKWGTGSDFQRAAQAATAALQGLAGGNVQAAISGAAAPYLAGVVKDMTDGNKEANVMAHALLGATLAQMKGESAAAGAAAAGASPLVAEYLQKTLYPDAKSLSEDQKQTISALTTMAGSLAGSLAGGDSAGALAGAQAAKNEVENNYLAADQITRLASQVKDCRSRHDAACIQKALETATKLSDANSKAMRSCGKDRACLDRHMKKIDQAAGVYQQITGLAQGGVDTAGLAFGNSETPTLTDTRYYFDQIRQNPELQTPFEKQFYAMKNSDRAGFETLIFGKPLNEKERFALLAGTAGNPIQGMLADAAASYAKDAGVSPQQLALLTVAVGSIKAVRPLSIDPKKFEYLFGNVNSNSHNADRSTQLAQTMRKLGLETNESGKRVLIEHFEKVVAEKSNVREVFSKGNQNFEIRESVLFGPSGKAVKLETSFEVMSDGTRRFVTTIPKEGG
ncbi:hemagglutinin repeat-containing protein [Chromobacterium piscinae]|uniref:hemagglutinin repeat-containing protein n=3 Tax=Chromobacterium piscinae TaxID=686831 RepID=UPI00361AEC0A